MGVESFDTCMTQKGWVKLAHFYYVVLCEKSEELESLNTSVMRNAYEKNILAKGTFLILLVDFDTVHGYLRPF